MAQKPVLEWICAIIGGLLTIITLIIIGMQIPANQASFPDLSIQQLETIRSGSGFVVLVEAQNSADMTAAAVNIEGVLRDGDTVLETARATFDYVPRHSKTRGGLLFTLDPAHHELSIRAAGYQQP